MEAVRLVIPAAAALVMAGAFFGVVFARVMWADEATHAGELKAGYEKIQNDYNKIHETDQQTIASMQQRIEMLTAGAR